MLILLNRPDKGEILLNIAHIQRVRTVYRESKKSTYIDTDQRWYEGSDSFEVKETPQEIQDIIMQTHYRIAQAQTEGGIKMQMHLQKQVVGGGLVLAKGGVPPEMKS